MKHRELKAKVLANPETLEAYRGMETEYELLRQMLKARAKAGLSQSQVASKMGTKAPAVTRLESALTSGSHSPTLATIQRYARAVGCELKVSLVSSRDVQPNKSPKRTASDGSH